MQLDSIQPLILKRLAMTFNLLMLKPVTHQEVIASVDLLMSSLEIFFELHSEIIFCCEKNEFILDNCDLTSFNIKYGATARELYLRGIKSIIFYKGVTKNTILVFLKLLTLNKECIKSQGSILSLVADLYLLYINVFSIMTNTYNVVEKTYSNYDKFIEDLNVQLKKSDSFTGRYFENDIIIQHLALILKTKYYSREKQDLEFIVRFMQGQIKEHLESLPDNDRLFKKKIMLLISLLPPGLIIKLRNTQQNRNSEESSDRQDFFDKFFNFSYSDQLLLLHQIILKNDILSIGQNSKQKEIKSKGFKQFQKKSSSELADIKQQFLKEIQPANSVTQIAKIVTHILDFEDNPSDYHKLLNILALQIDHFIEVENFSLILDIYTTLERHTCLKKNELIKSAAVKVLEETFSAEVVMVFLELWLKADSRHNKYLEKLILRLNRPIVITEMKALYFTTKDLLEQKKLEYILSKSINDVTILEHDIKNADEKSLSLLIKLLESIKSDQAAVYLNELCMHRINKVKNEAFVSLCKHETKKSISMIIEMIPKISFIKLKQAAPFITRSNYYDSFKELSAFMGCKDLLERNIKKRFLILEAIQINRNKYALPMLQSLVGKKIVFRKKMNLLFQKHIYRALKSIGNSEAVNIINQMSDFYSNG